MLVEIMTTYIVKTLETSGIFATKIADLRKCSIFLVT
jgi:hypothetical protein